MHYTQKGLSFLIVLTLCIQPVFAEELIPEDAILRMETPTEPLLTEVAPDVSIEVAPVKEVESTSPEVVVPISSTEFISASVEEPIAQKKSGVDIGNELLVTESDYVAGEILVKYKDTKIDLTKTSGRKTASNIAKGASLKKKDDMRESNISLLEIIDTETVEEKIDELEANPNVEYAQPNFIYTPSSITPPNDPFWTELWGLDNQGQGVNESLGTPNADINAPEAWAINEGTNATIIVAIIDTGVAYNHPDLLPNMWDGSECVDENGNALGNCNHGYDYEDGDKTPLPTQSSHGTHIAGTIAAVKNNGKGVVGVAPHTKIMSIKAGSASLTSANIVKSIHFAQQNNATIINASWEGPSFDQSIKDAIEAFPGLFVTAAGNSAHDNEITPAFPSNLELPNIISVAATDQNDGLAYFSNYGATSVDVGAPGTSIYNTIATQTLVLDESFDTVVAPGIPDGWTTEGTENNWGTYDLGEGSNVLYADLAVPYANSADTSITSPSFNLQNSTAYLQFLTACDTEYTTDWHDYLQLEYSEDGTTFLPAPDPFTGEAFKWSEKSLDALKGIPTDEIGSDIGLSAFLYSGILIPEQYLTNNFKFRFHWITNESDNEYDGCLVGEIELFTFSDGSDEQYDFMQGTSMAAPHVAGLAALVKGYAPNLSVSQVKDIILTTGDAIPSLSSTTVTGKRINAHNALRSIKTINTFSVPSQIGTTTLDETAHTISLTVPFGTEVTALTPTFTFSGSSTTPLSDSAQNFSAPVTYTVTAHDETTQDYIVTVLIAPAPPAPPVVEAPRNSSGGGGGGGGGSSKKKTKVSTPISVTPLTSVGTTSRVVKQTFTLENAIGSQNTEVTELQKVLIAGKFLVGTVPTGYYGPLTARAVQDYQKAHGIPQTGIVDTATRAKLNGNVTATTYDAQRAALLKVLQAKLLELLAELQALKAR